MTPEEIKAKAEEYITKNADKYFTDNRYYHLKDGYIDGATMMQEQQDHDKQLYGEVVEALENMICAIEHRDFKLNTPNFSKILKEAKSALNSLKQDKV